MSEEQRRRRVRALLGGVTAVAGQRAVQEPKATELSPEAVAVLVKAGLEPDRTLLELYRDLNLHAAEGTAAREQLGARGMVRPHRLARKGRGGQPQVLEVLPAGVAELGKRGIKLAEKKLKRGGFKHDV